MSKPVCPARGTYTFQQTFYMHPPSPDAPHSSRSSYSLSQTFTFARSSSSPSSHILTQTIHVHPAPSSSSSSSVSSSSSSSSVSSSSSSSSPLPSVAERTAEVMRDKVKFKTDIGNVKINAEKVKQDRRYKTGLCRSVYERVRCRFITDDNIDKCRYAHGFPEWWAYNAHRNLPFKTTGCTGIHNKENPIGNCRFLHDGDLACTGTKGESTFVNDDFYIYRNPSTSSSQSIAPPTHTSTPPKPPEASPHSLSSTPISRTPTPLTPTEAPPHSFSSTPISRTPTPLTPPEAPPHPFSSTPTSRTPTPLTPTEPSPVSPHSFTPTHVSRTPTLLSSEVSPTSLSSTPRHHFLPILLNPWADAFTPTRPSPCMDIREIAYHDDIRNVSVFNWLRLDEELLPRRPLPVRRDRHVIDQSFYEWLLRLADVEL